MPAFNVLQRIALARMWLLLTQHGAQQGAPISANDLRQVCRADTAPEPYARPLAVLANILASAPFVGNLDGREALTQDYLNAVRDRLVELTRLELEVLRSTAE